MNRIGIKNIGTLLSGDINKPILNASAILVEDGIIAKIGDDSILEGVEKIIDAKGTTVMPGLIDSHCHPVFGDFTPRQDTLNFISSALHGGVTSMISAGECHFPGRPKDRQGTKALALLAHKASQNKRPAGVKLHGGGLILEKGLLEEDFAELAAEGVWIVGEVGLGSVNSPEIAAPMVAQAKKHGFKVQMHTGGTSIPGSSSISADDVIAINPDVVSHLNGGPTAIPFHEVEKIIDETDLTLEVIQCGNFNIMQRAINKVNEKGELSRIIIGNDAPSGTGVIALGIIRTISFIASMTDVSAEQAVCFATGNTARTYGLNAGMVEEGREADLVILDAPMGSAGEGALGAFEIGDIPGISMALIDGEIMYNKSRNTPPATTKAEIL